MRETPKATHMPTAISEPTAFAISRTHPPIRRPSLNRGRDENDCEDVHTEYHNAQPLRPLVEWFNPNQNEPNDEINEPSQQQQGPADRIPSTIVVDPSQTIIIPTINGEIVRPRRCYVKIYGLRLCDDNFPTKINPCILFIILIIALAVGLTGRLLHSPVGSFAQVESNDAPFTKSPSVVPSMSPSLDARAMNITEMLLSVSGDVMYDIDSPQNRALRWILYEDEMILTYESSNLVQKYALMVLYYSMSGEEWSSNDGYGSEMHECDWYGVECISFSSQVDVIDLERNNLVGKMPQEIGYLNQMKEIWFSFNRIGGSIPSSIGMLGNLEYFQISQNELSGTIPDEMKNCRSLQLLKADSNQLIGTMPTFLGDLRSLEIINLMRNKLTGTIPSNLSNIHRLETLRLAQNKLTGTIPSELGKCQFLKNLYLNNNELEGTIPSSLSNLNTLIDLWLHYNLLSGTIPKQIAMLSNLKRFFMHNNRLRGTIPDALGSMTKLNKMKLSNNLINGTIPSSFDNFDNLDTLELHGNMITGEVSARICSFLLISFTADCLGLDPKLSCSCCTECY